MTISEIIAALGGRRAVAEHLGISVNALSMWKRRGISPVQWFDLLDLARKHKVKGVTLEVLAAHSSRPPTKRRGAGC